MTTCFAILLAAGGNPVIGAMEGMRSALVNGKLSAFGSLAAVIAGLLCAFVFLKISHDYLEGNGITLWQVIRPLVLLVLCCNFNLFVAGPIHSMCNLVTNGMGRQCQMSATAFTKAVQKQFQVQYNSSQLKLAAELEKTKKANEDLQASVQVKEGNWFQRTGSAIVNAGATLMKAAGNWLGFGCKAVLNDLDLRFSGVFLIIIESLLVLIMKMMILGQQIYCYIYLTILTLLGPFVFALAIVPSFGHSISSWIARYIQVAFWIPIGQLIMFLNFQILGRITELTAGYDFGEKYVMIVALFVCILNVKAVPQIAAYVVESSGDNGAMAASGLRNSTREGVQTVGAIKSLVTKGA